MIPQINCRDALIIVPPFASLAMPSIGAHILQSCAHENGFEVGILYANIIFGAKIGVGIYEEICGNINGQLIGERIFVPAAYESLRFNADPENSDSGNCKSRNTSSHLGIEDSELERLESIAIKYIDTISKAVAELDTKVVGCTNSFQQTLSGMALLRKIKFHNQGIITIMGGANCQGTMAKGMLSLGSAVDYVFSGESESSFVKFLNIIKEGNRPESNIIPGDPCTNLDGIPTPKFHDYYNQLEHQLPHNSMINSSNVWLPFESSRGCWWGQKHKCKFCGIDKEVIKYRQKTPERVISELSELLRYHPNKNIFMVDNIMPHTYFKTLLPNLTDYFPGVNIFYEQKANLSLKDVITLKKAGIRVIQPGIESLSAQCLRLTNKGVSSSQNIALLRYARSVGLALNWNFLYAIPNDTIDEYKDILEIIPLLHHLHPPASLLPISIIRFSPYFESPSEYGISNIRPIGPYNAILPEKEDITSIAYYFIGDYESESRNNFDIMNQLRTEIERWYNSWNAKDIPPILSIIDLGEDRYLLLDTRELPGTKRIQFISHNQALMALVGKTVESRGELKWAIEKKLLIELDSKYVPLATALPTTLCKFELEA